MFRSDTVAIRISSGDPAFARDRLTAGSESRAALQQVSTLLHREPDGFLVSSISIDPDKPGWWSGMPD
jgi:hypothetical protein